MVAMNAPVQTAVFLGTATVDVVTTALPDSAEDWHAEKTETQIDVQLGGCPIHAARAYRLACGSEPHLMAILGPDRLGDFAASMMRNEFRHFRTLKTIRSTRISVNWPEDIGHAISGKTFTTRSSVDGDRTLASLGRVLDSSSHLLVGPMSASDTPWLHEVLRRFSRNSEGLSFLLLSREQLRDREAAVRLCRRAEYVVLNRAEASLLVGTSLSANVPELKTRFSNLEIRRAIVTDGADGVHAFVNGEAIFEPATPVGMQHTVGAGDTFVGTLIAALIDGRSLQHAMRLAGAASALHVSKAPRQGGWAELEGILQVSHTVSSAARNHESASST
ncbi:MAG: carbohydrate kinase family protein [Planctomycetaceae bacterium]